MSVRMEHTPAWLMPRAATPNCHTAASVNQDFLEMGTVVQVLSR